MTITTLCYIENNGKYLMLHRVKKHNDINEGKWIGVGGHAEGQESPEECLLREVKEETGLTLTSYKLRGLVTFISDKCEPELMCVFTANEYIGELTECNEGELYWIDKAVVPTLPTWEADRVFLDLLLSGDERFFSLKLLLFAREFRQRMFEFVHLPFPDILKQIFLYLQLQYLRFRRPIFFLDRNQHL